LLKKQTQNCGMTTPLSSATAANAYMPLVSAAPAPNTAAIADLAVNLSNNASVIASIGGSSTAGAGVYNAQGLMNNFLQAAARNLAANVASADSATTSNDTATTNASSLSNTTVLDASVGEQQANGNTFDTNGTGTGSGTDPTAFNGTPDWATVLKSNPSLTGVFLADSTNQLLVNQLSVLA
jgi:hypothetical protein